MIHKVDDDMWVEIKQVKLRIMSKD